MLTNQTSVEHSFGTGETSVAFFWHWPGVSSILFEPARRQYSILFEPARRQYINLWGVKFWYERSVFTLLGVGYKYGLSLEW